MWLRALSAIYPSVAAMSTSSMVGETCRRQRVRQYAPGACLICLVGMSERLEPQDARELSHGEFGIGESMARCSTFRNAAWDL